MAKRFYRVAGHSNTCVFRYLENKLKINHNIKRPAGYKQTGVRTMIKDIRKIKKDKDSKEFEINVKIPETMAELQGLFSSLDESSVVRAAFESLHIDRCAAIRKVMSEDMTTEQVQAGIDTWQPGTGKIKKTDYISAMFTLSQELADICFRLQDRKTNQLVMSMLSYADKGNKIELIKDNYDKMVRLKNELETRIED